MFTFHDVKMCILIFLNIYKTLGIVDYRSKPFLIVHVFCLFKIFYSIVSRFSPKFVTPLRLFLPASSFLQLKNNSASFIDVVIGQGIGILHEDSLFKYIISTIKHFFHFNVISRHHAYHTHVCTRNSYVS